MNISWVLADSAAIDPTQSIDALKRIGAFWGSWRTWRAYQTDNVICHDQVKAVELYAGEFVHDVIRQEEIVAVHLAATTSDIVLLLGWDLAELPPDADKLRANQTQHHRNLLYQALKDYTQIQWVVVDHPGKLAPNLANLDNVTTDTMDAVLALVGD